ncbi:MAG: hypothetical protein LBV70_03815 [Candidatus Adiutrix sp.]|jgi:hypothetical protein|nr:hypothetical protein [Candidatus Adiutrix sp.]
MSTINNILFNLRNQAPALLQMGGGKTENYQNLASLTDSLWGDTQLMGSGGNKAQDMVRLAYQNIGQKVVSDMAGLTAEAIRADPTLDNDYFIAVIETGSGREARVYRRSEILSGFEGLEKNVLEAQMAADPLQVFSSAKGLPPGSSDAACQKLASQLNGFLKLNAKTINTLNSAGYDPFQDHQASSAIQKALQS